jgi:hypothetical protein
MQTRGAHAGGDGIIISVLSTHVYTTLFESRDLISTTLRLCSAASVVITATDLSLVLSTYLLTVFFRLPISMFIHYCLDSFLPLSCLITVFILCF